MFAHEVTEKVSKAMKIYKGMDRTGDPVGGKLLEIGGTILEMVRCSIKFHMGDMEGFRGIRDADKGKMLFSDPTYLKLPYPITYYDCTLTEYGKACAEELCSTCRVKCSDDGREAVVCKEVPLPGDSKESLWEIYCFTHRNKVWNWQPLILYAQPGGIREEGKEYLKQRFNATHVNNYFSKPEGDGRGIYVFPVYFGIEYPLSKEMITNFRIRTEMNLTLLVYSVQLLNCRNIIRVDVSPEEKEQRRRKLSGKQELFTYKVLKIKANKASQGKEGEHEPTGLHNRVHLCRGHFKTYTEESPLLGKLTGRWWWQPAVRGRNRDGIIIKDYEVENNKNDSGEVAA